MYYITYVSQQNGYVFKKDKLTGVVTQIAEIPYVGELRFCCGDENTIIISGLVGEYPASYCFLNIIKHLTF